MRVKIHYILIVIFVTIISCNSNSTSITSKNFAKSQVDSISSIDIIKTKKVKTSTINSNESYCIFLPSNYNDEKKYEAIVFFDAHAEGFKIIEKYVDLAEKWDVVIACSNNSKNGLDFNTINTYANNFISHLLNSYSIKPELTLAGFSGGAKVAIMYGASNPNVDKIIYCGATVIAKANHKIKYLGFAGLKDMNYSDLVLFDSQLDNITPHYLIEWKGIHEWPSKEVFENAFYFAINNSIDNYDSKKITTPSTTLNLETSIKQELYEYFNSKNLSWWQNTITQFNTKKNDELMYERLLGFVSLACYSQLNNMQNNSNANEAKKILSIFMLADPNNTSIPDFKQKFGMP